MLAWFSRPLNLSEFLTRWERTGIDYDPETPIDATWHVDSSETDLGPAEDARLFAAAVETLFRYDCYPGNVLAAHAPFIEENRPPRPGDRILQRIRVLPFFLDAVTLNIVTAAWHETDRRGFTVHTSSRHFEVGEWTSGVVRRPGGRITFLTHSISRPAPTLPAIAHGFARALQLRAKRLSGPYFRSQVLKQAGQGEKA